MAKRAGTFVVLEGLEAKGHPAELWRFPERSTEIGKIIDGYLKKKIELDDRAIHLLYSANRWERLAVLNETLARGVTVVMDRYAFSGVAFSSAKKGMDLHWCMQPDAGLPAPDVLLHLELGASEAEARGGFGEERYEVSEFQAQVKDQFTKLYGMLVNVHPKVLDVSGMSVEDVGEKIEEIVLAEVNTAEKQRKVLW